MSETIFLGLMTMLVILISTGVATVFVLVVNYYEENEHRRYMEYSKAHWNYVKGFCTQSDKEGGE